MRVKSWTVRKGDTETEYRYFDIALWAALELIGEGNGLQYDHDRKLITITEEEQE